MERTFAMLKPDAVQRGLTGEIIARFERRGLKIVAMKFMTVPRELAEKHYGEHVGKPFYENLLSFITSGPVVPMILEGENAVEMVRGMMGATHPQKSAPGTIRGDFGQNMGRNIIHGSDSPESAAREMALWFPDGEIVDWEKIDAEWLFE